MKSEVFNMELNKIYEEDCMETMDRMHNNFVQLSITSPPYNIGKNNYSAAPKYNSYSDSMSKESYFKWIDSVLKEMIRVTEYHVFFNIQEISGNKGIVAYLITQNEEYYKDCIIWHKKNSPPVIEPGVLQSCYEHILIFSKDQPSKRKFTYTSFERELKNVFHYANNSDEESKFHGVAFPEWLPRTIIYYFSKEGDIVYDPFGGSGTTAKCATLEKRKWILSEIDKEYIEQSSKRIDAHVRQTSFF